MSRTASKAQSFGHCFASTGHPNSLTMGRGGATSRVSTTHRLSSVYDLTLWNLKRSGTSAHGFCSPLESLSTLPSDGEDLPIPGDQPPSISTHIPTRPPTPGPSRHARGVSESNTSATRRDNNSIRPRPGMSSAGPHFHYNLYPQKKLSGRKVYPFHINSGKKLFLPPPLERACSDLSKLLDPQCTSGIPFRELLESLWRCSNCDNIMLEPFASRHTCPPSPEGRSGE